jgi:hypothetical protein
MTTPDFCYTDECSSHKECYFNTKVWPVLDTMYRSTNPDFDNRVILETRNHEYHLGGLKAVMDMVENLLDFYSKEFVFEVGECDEGEGEDPAVCEIIRDLKKQVEACEEAIRKLNALPPMNA